MITIETIKSQLERMGFTKTIYISEPEFCTDEFGETVVEIIYSNNKEDFEETLKDGHYLYNNCYDCLVTDDEDASYICACEIIMQYK